MALRDYSEDDDFYTQGFEQPGVFSLWVSTSVAEPNSQIDVLQDLCGVGYYSLDDQEANALNGLVPLEELLRELSYSESFMANVLASAHASGVNLACWVVVQFDFAYNPTKVQRSVSSDVRFLGVFPYVVA